MSDSCTFYSSAKEAFVFGAKLPYAFEAKDQLTMLVDLRRNYLVEAAVMGMLKENVFTIEKNRLFELSKEQRDHLLEALPKLVDSNAFENYAECLVWFRNDAEELLRQIDFETQRFFFSYG